MTISAFQSSLARLVIEPNFAAAVQNGQGLDPMLSPLEQTRLIAIARDGGLAVTRTLHHGFRLNKIIGRLPLCRTLLGERGMARALEDYWSHNLPVSFYYLHEAIAFSEHLIELSRDKLKLPFLGDVAAFERAQLKLRSTDAADEGYFEAVPFQHDPTRLLAELRSGVVPATVRRADVVLIGSVDKLGCTQWHTMHGAAWRAWLADKAVA